MNEKRQYATLYMIELKTFDNGKQKINVSGLALKKEIIKYKCWMTIQKDITGLM